MSNMQKSNQKTNFFRHHQKPLFDKFGWNSPFWTNMQKKLPKMTLMGYKNGSGGTNFPSELFPLDAFARGGGAETASDDFRGGIWSIIYIGQDDVADHVTTLQAFDQKPDKKMSQFPAGAFTLLRVQKFTKKMHSWCTAQKTPLSHPEKHQSTVQVSFLVQVYFCNFRLQTPGSVRTGFQGFWMSNNGIVFAVFYLKKNFSKKVIFSKLFFFWVWKEKRSKDDQTEKKNLKRVGLTNLKTPWKNLNPRPRRDSKTAKPTCHSGDCL